MENYNDLDRYQDILGQLPMLQTYSHVLYFFPMPPNVSKEEIIDDLEEAVTKVREKIPWMGARVINVGKCAGNSGVYRAIECEWPNPAIDVKNVIEELPEYAVIQAQKAPLSMINTKLLTPVVGFPERFEDSDEHPAHVVRLQATFIRGGVILDFAIAHIMGDAGGHFGFVKLVAMAMRGEQFPDALLEQANRDRRNLVPLLRPDEPLLDHSHHLRPLATNSTSLTMPKPEAARYHIFRFTVANMAKLKKLASQEEGFNPDVLFISTDDALCAFCWQRFIKARKQLFPPETVSRFGRQIDGRKLVGLAPDYMGDVICNVCTWMTFEELTESPLSTVASQLRKQLNQANNSYYLRSFATFIAREPDKSLITYGGKFDPRIESGCSSIRGLAGVFPDFGKLGAPEYIRRPPSMPFTSTVVFFPGTPEGDCDASICLTDKEFEILSAEPEWTQYVEYIG
ncbi:trichothecene biosynthesis acetyltransferase [Bisporella sp. PMI_857]|nr:trichothecene biosynthesis acetyltransferase [Bisporella sp. PMI_857]